MPPAVAAFEVMANLATAAGVSGAGRTVIHTPLIHLSKAEIIRLGREMGVDYSKTISLPFKIGISFLLMNITILDGI